MNDDTHSSIHCTFEAYFHASTCGMQGWCLELDNNLSINVKFQLCACFYFVFVQCFEYSNNCLNSRMND